MNDGLRAIISRRARDWREAIFDRLHRHIRAGDGALSDQFPANRHIAVTIMAIMGQPPGPAIGQAGDAGPWFARKKRQRDRHASTLALPARAPAPVARRS